MDLFDKIQTAGEPFINGDSLNDFYGDLKNNSFIFQWQVISELTTRNRQFKGQDILLERNIEDAIFVFTGPVLHEQGYISDKQRNILMNVYFSLDDRIKADYYSKSYVICPLCKYMLQYNLYMAITYNVLDQHM